MFSEMFITMKERSKVGQLRIVFAIIGVAIGFWRSFFYYNRSHESK